MPGLGTEGSPALLTSVAWLRAVWKTVLRLWFSPQGLCSNASSWTRAMEKRSDKKTSLSYVI